MAKAARWKDLTGPVREDKPWLGGLPRLIFVSDMSDALSSVVPSEYLPDEIAAIVTTPEGRRHRWLGLTKRPDRMAKFSAFLRDEGIARPDNLWAGTSITTRLTTSRINSLLRVGGDNTTRFLSVKPQVEPIDDSAWLPKPVRVIQGGGSGHDARPFHVEWALDFIRQCVAAGVPYFLKQLGTMAYLRGQSLNLADDHGGDRAEWPQAIRVGEMPVAPDWTDGAVPAVNARLDMDVVLAEEARRGEVGSTPGNLAERRRRASMKAWDTRRAKRADRG